MIDIHSHLLPGVDDGSADINVSVDLLKKAWAQGVTDMILTPHYRGEYKEEKTKILSEFENLKTELINGGVNINVYLGQEIHVEKDYKSLVKSERVFPLNGTKYLLIEFNFEHFCDIVNIVYELVIEGYKPIVAHLERYDYADIRMAHEIREVGGLIQVNAESIVCRVPKKERQLVKQLFKAGLVDFVASDMHSERINFMDKAYDKVRKRYGLNTAEKIFNENAKEIIKGQS